MDKTYRVVYREHNSPTWEEWVHVLYRPMAEDIRERLLNRDPWGVLHVAEARVVEVGGSV